MDHRDKIENNKYMNNKIKLLCKCGEEYNIDKDDDLPKGVKSIGCNWCPLCEPTDYYTEYYNYDDLIVTEDIKYETYRSNKHGGQLVNLNDKCVKVTDIKTGISVEECGTRYQYKNKDIALIKLNIKLNKHYDK